MSSQHKKLLMEKWNPVLDVENLNKISDSEQRFMIAQLCENTEKYLVENANDTADVQQFHPILVPTVRRVFPGLLANELVGIQPMNSPVGYAYALRYGYAGYDTKGVDGVSPLDRGDNGSTNPLFKGVILTLANATDFGVGDPITLTGNVSVGTVRYKEGNNILVQLTTDSSSIAITNTVSDNATFADGTQTTISAIYTNEAGFNVILKNYSGWLSTAAGEVLGANMPSMRLTMERISATAQTRKLKAEYSVEMQQDLKSMHNMDAEAELTKILEYEISAEIDRYLVDTINNNASTATGWSYGDIGAPTGTADGQWESEKLRTLYTQIVKEANNIAITTRRGPGNFIICSTNVLTALQSLQSFMYNPVQSHLGAVGGVSKVGTLDGRFAVYLDTFATEDYATVGYKGASAMDTGVIYMPYIPMMFQKIIHPDTFQPAISVMTRAATVFNMFGTGNY